MLFFFSFSAFIQSDNVIEVLRFDEGGLLEVTFYLIAKNLNAVFKLCASVLIFLKLEAL